MKAHVRVDMFGDNADVWIWDPLGDGKRAVWQPVDGDSRIEIVEAGAEPAPSLRIPLPALEALVAASADHMPPSSAQAHHLADVIGVRDRLLTVVENTTKGD